MDWFRPDVETSNEKAGCSSPIAFIVGMVLSLSKSFGCFVVLQLLSQCWDLFGDRTCVLWSLEVLWTNFVHWWVLVCKFKQSFVDT